MVNLGKVAKMRVRVLTPRPAPSNEQSHTKCRPYRSRTQWKLKGVLRALAIVPILASLRAPVVWQEMLSLRSLQLCDRRSRGSEAPLGDQIADNV
jgi:hypothetical protein